MTNRPIITWIFIFFLFLVNCTKKLNGPDDLQNTNLSGSYLGQESPGIIPVRFTPDILMADGTWWWHDAPVFSPDGEELYMSFYDTGLTPNVSIDFMQVENGFWTFPQTVSFSGTFRDNGPRFNMEGNKLFFTSRRSGGALFVVNRTGESWSVPEVVGIPNITSDDLVGISITQNETIYFGDVNSGHLDIYRTRSINGHYEIPENLGSSINTDSEEWGPYVDPNEDFIIFTSNRPGGFGLHDLYISFHNPDGSWTNAQNMGNVINSSNEDGSPLISPDGLYLFFITSRGNDLGYNPYWVDAQIIENYL